MISLLELQAIQFGRWCSVLSTNSYIWSVDKGRQNTSAEKDGKTVQNYIYETCKLESKQVQDHS